MLIIDMPMPQACRWKEDGTTKRCPIAEWGGACAVTKLFEPFDDNRPSWCPIKGELVTCGECIMGFEESGEK